MMFNSTHPWTNLMFVVASAIGFGAALAVPAAAVNLDTVLHENSEHLLAQADVDPDYEIPAETNASPPAALPEAGETSVSSDELEQFANTIPQLLAIEQAGQEQVAQVIDASGLERDRFYEIYQGLAAPSASEPGEAAVTTTEQSSFEMALSRIGEIEQEIRSQQAGVIAASGIEPERFNEIMAAVLNDPELQLEVQELMAP